VSSRGLFVGPIVAWRTDGCGAMNRFFFFCCRVTHIEFEKVTKILKNSPH
jgi:hypothetical protein